MSTALVFALVLKMLRNLRDSVLNCVSHTLIPTLLSIKDFPDERRNPVCPVSNAAVYPS